MVGKLPLFALGWAGSHLGIHRGPQITKFVGVKKIEGRELPYSDQSLGCLGGV